MSLSLYWKLSAFYFFYFASLGALIPYWNPYLKTLGFSDAAIGELIAMIMATKVIAPNIWGWIADHTGKRVRIIRLASLLSVLCFAGVLFGSGYAWMLLVMLGFSFFWNASLPQVEAVTMNHFQADTRSYNTIRLWGSVGFVVAVVLLGYLFVSLSPGSPGSAAPSAVAISYLPVILLGLFAGIWITSLFVPEEPPTAMPRQRRPLGDSLYQRNAVFLLLVAFLLQASHGPYYVFFTRYLQEWNYRSATIGILWAWAVIAEILVFLVIHRLLQRLGARRLLMAALLLTTLRWLLIAWLPGNLLLLSFAQTLHAASFGVVHAVSIYLIHRYFTHDHQGRGQALYSSLSFGLGGAVGSLVSGYLWAPVGGAMVFYIAAAISFVALLFAWYGIERQ